jgi:acetyl-CoA carboxylase carboxyl transferase subunit beta
LTSWFSRKKEGITTTTKDKKEIKEGLWYQCPQCKKTTSAKDHQDNLYTCSGCEYHEKIGSKCYFHFLFDDAEYEILFNHLRSVDTLSFKDLKPYDKRLEETIEETGLDEAIQVAHGTMIGKEVIIACMDFSFIGGSMGSVVGEKIALSIDYCIEQNLPLIIISKSGGARMMESTYSLMQMAKTAAKLTQLAKAKLPYISVMTNPTTGGVTASFAMLGDVNIAEPNALIGFAGPRVIQETIKKELPENFQMSESLFENGFLDMVINRKELKEKLVKLLDFFEKAN